jgi:hypothetical protein
MPMQRTQRREQIERGEVYRNGASIKSIIRVV